MANSYGRQVVLTLTNKSGGGVIAGDVVIADTTNDGAFTTTTVAQSQKSVGVAQETIANNASGRILVSGYAALVNVQASVTRGHYAETYSVAKQGNGNSARRAGSFGQFLTGGTTPTAWLWGFPDNAGASGETVATSTIWDAAGDLAVGTGADTGARVARGTTAQVLVSTATTVAWADVLPWHVYIIPMITTQDASTGTWTLISSTDSGLIFPFYTPGSTANSGGASNITNASAVAINDAWAVDVILAAGTWDFHIWVRKSTNTGIITLQQDGSDMGTVDTYAAAAATAKVSITGWTVSTTGKKRMNLKMATKNGSSTNYVLAFHGIEFRRTA